MLGPPLRKKTAMRKDGWKITAKAPNTYDASTGLCVLVVWKQRLSSRDTHAQDLHSRGILFPGFKQLLFSKKLKCKELSVIKAGKNYSLAPGGRN